MARLIYWTEEKKSEAFAKIAARIGAGESMRSILDGADRKKYPSFKVFLQWIETDPKLKEQYKALTGKQDAPEEVGEEPEQTPEQAIIEYFKTAQLPGHSIDLPGGTVVTNVRAYADHYLFIYENGSDEGTKLSALDALRKLKNVVSTA